MKSKKSRRKFSSAFKTKVSLEALKERETLSELAKRFDLHPNQISQWKKEFLSKADSVFANKSTDKDADEIDVEVLYSKIGKLEVERDFLKKSLSKLH